MRRTVLVVFGFVLMLSTATTTAKTRRGICGKRILTAEDVVSQSMDAISSVKATRQILDSLPEPGDLSDALRDVSLIDDTMRDLTGSHVFSRAHQLTFQAHSGDVESQAMKATRSALMNAMKQMATNAKLMRRLNGACETLRVQAARGFAGYCNSKRADEARRACNAILPVLIRHMDPMIVGASLDHGILSVQPVPMTLDSIPVTLDSSPMTLDSSTMTLDSIPLSLRLARSASSGTEYIDGLEGLEHWERFESVRVLRRIWDNLKYALISSRDAVQFRTEATVKVRGEAALKAPLGNPLLRAKREISIEDALDGLAAISKSLLNLELWIDPFAERDGDYSFVLVVSKNGETRGRIHLDLDPANHQTGHSVLAPYIPSGHTGRVGTRSGSPGEAYIILAGARESFDSEGERPTEGDMSAWGEIKNVKSTAGKIPTGGKIPTAGEIAGSDEESSTSLASDPFATSQRQSMRRLRIFDLSFYFLATTLADIFVGFLNESEFVGAVSTRNPWTHRLIAIRLLELLARDWLDARTGVPLEGPAGGTGSFGWGTVAANLALGASFAAAHKGRRNCNVVQVLRETSERFIELLNSEEFSRIPVDAIGAIVDVKGPSGMEYFGLTPAIVAMVHSHGAYRGKVYDLVARLGVLRGASPKVSASVKLSDSFILGESDRISASSTEDGLRKFFAGELTDDCIGLALRIVPGLDSRTSTGSARSGFASSINTIIDFEPLRREMSNSLSMF